MATAARLLPKIQSPASPAVAEARRRRPSNLRLGATSGPARTLKQKLVAKSAVSVVEGENAFDGVKQDTRPIIVIDNYDSFTYNLCQYMGEVGAYFEVYRNDDITMEEIKKISPRGILISPGPGTPQDSGISLQTVQDLGPSTPLFGVCMGLQCIGEAFGGKVVRSPYGVVHGKGSLVHYEEKLDGTLFSGLPNPFQAGRYHSLGVQFHPESIITTEGRLMVKNFIKIIEGYEALNCFP
uniref:anthranilate synthase n=1 Tax=Oryza meridionalis TaxID=40149 RepID=A0A0E0D5R4_9ORYZ